MCPPEFVLCGAECVDLATDPRNCGACGAVCTVGVCSFGLCDACACPAGLVCCGSLCADLSTDATNCGACGLRCPPSEVCVAGACQP